MAFGFELLAELYRGTPAAKRYRQLARQAGAFLAMKNFDVAAFQLWMARAQKQRPTNAER